MEAGERIEASAVLTSDGKHVAFGGYDGQLHVHDAVTGAAHWMFDTGGQVCLAHRRTLTLFTAFHCPFWHPCSLPFIDYLLPHCLSLTVH